MYHADTIDLPDTTIDTYHAVMDAIGGDIDGLVLHAAGTTHDGVRIVEVWESKAHKERFVAERLHPTFERIGHLPTARAQASGFEASATIVGRAVAAHS